MSQPGLGRLGAILAGGESSRFGSDKALAQIDGTTMLERAVALLTACCDAVIVVGRDTASVRTIADWPRGGMGPLGGIAAALRLAEDEGFAEVLTIGVDCPDLPENMPALLSPAPAVLAAQPVIGLWPVSTRAAAETILTGPGRHSLRALAEATGARMVRTAEAPANINTPADLAALAAKHAESRHGL